MNNYIENIKLTIEYYHNMSQKNTNIKLSKQPKQSEELKQFEEFNIESNFYTKCKSIEDKFKLFATSLLSNFTIKVNNDLISIEEIEFYYNSKDHKDHYTHKNKDQLTNSMWYFHQYHNGTYKSGTYKGLDMTFGNNKDSYGGILIRSINNTTTNEFITGPCNVVNYILKKLNCESIEILVEKMKDKNIFNNKNPFYVEKNNQQNNIEQNNKEVKIFMGPRVGLSLKYPEYLIKEYRYLKQPNLIPKYRTTIISSLHNKGLTKDEIEQTTKLSKTSIKKAIEEFEEGCNLSETNLKNLKADKINKIFGYYCKNNQSNKSNKSNKSITLNIVSDVVPDVVDEKIVKIKKSIKTK